MSNIICAELYTSAITSGYALTHPARVWHKAVRPVAGGDASTIIL
jgi:hypothetical protein